MKGFYKNLKTQERFNKIKVFPICIRKAPPSKSKIGPKFWQEEDSDQILKNWQIKDIGLQVFCQWGI